MNNGLPNCQTMGQN